MKLWIWMECIFGTTHNYKVYSLLIDQVNQFLAGKRLSQNVLGYDFLHDLLGATAYGKDPVVPVESLQS